MKDRIKATCFLMAMLTVLNMSGCAKKVKCSETANHSHLYECSIDDVTVKRYFTSEYEEKKEGDLVFDRTKYYSFSTKRLNLIIDNDLANMNDNFEYLAYLEENGYKNSKNKWICYCIDIYYAWRSTVTSKLQVQTKKTPASARKSAKQSFIPKMSPFIRLPR